jgi:hypothetical protein
MLRLLHTSARRLVAASGSASAAAPAPAARAAYRASPVARAAAARPAPAAPAASAPSTSAAAAPASPAAAAAASAPSAPPAPAPDAPGDTSESQWSTSFAGLGSAPFEPRIADILGREVNGEDVEIKPGECGGVVQCARTATRARWTQPRAAEQAGEDAGSPVTIAALGNGLGCRSRRLAGF